MATHSSVLAWRIPGTGEPGGLLSMGPRRLKRLSSSSISVFICKSSSESEVHSKLKVKKIYRGNFPERSVKGGGAAAARAVHSNALLPALLEKKKENIQVE